MSDFQELIPITEENIRVSLRQEVGDKESITRVAEWVKDLSLCSVEDPPELENIDEGHPSTVLMATETAIPVQSKSVKKITNVKRPRPLKTSTTFSSSGCFIPPPTVPASVPIPPPTWGILSELNESKSNENQRPTCSDQVKIQDDHMEVTLKDEQMTHTENQVLTNADPMSLPGNQTVGNEGQMMELNKERKIESTENKKEEPFTYFISDVTRCSTVMTDNSPLEYTEYLDLYNDRVTIRSKDFGLVLGVKEILRTAMFDLLKENHQEKKFPLDGTSSKNFISPPKPPPSPIDDSLSSLSQCDVRHGSISDSFT